jgi:hypothetical protein
MKVKVYQEIVKTLMHNDRNATWDEILEEAEGDLDKALSILIDALTRIVEEDGLEGEELEFYEYQLTRAKTIA